jgi:pyruvate dehydrogenase E2 component (dihydrolipoyllysine-residue acetyltransferase)
MAQELFIPKLGQTVEEVTLIDWLVKDGDTVEQGVPVLEVETDKAVFPVEANASGVIHLGPFHKGDVLPVVTVVAVIGAADEAYPTEVGAGQAPAAMDTSHPAPSTVYSRMHVEEPHVTSDTDARVFVSPRARKLAYEKGVDLRLVQPSGGEGVRVIEKDVLDFLTQQPKATPVARRVAAGAGLPLQEVSGSGPGGRITRADVERSIVSAAPSPTPPPAPVLPLADLEVTERIPLSGIRGIIANRMATSVHTTARVTLVMEVDATQLVQLRTRLKARVEEEWGFAPGYNDLLGKMLATALRRFPYMNARLNGEAIELIKPVNLGMATDTEHGLLVPVIRDADRKSLRQFGFEFRQLAERARNRKSLPEDLSGGTFTLTSLGAFGVDAFTPVINLPEAAILGVGRIAPRPVAVDDQVVVRSMLTLSLVFDHRLVDGAPAARFLAYLKDLIEEPYLWISAIQE